MKKSEKKSEKKLQKEQKANPKKEIKEFYDTVVKNSVEEFSRKKGIHPHVILYTTQKKMLVAPMMDCKDSEERFKLLAQLGKRLKEENVSVELAISISESWMSIKAENDGKKPSDDPNKQEILMLSAIDNIDNSIVTMYRINRNGEEITTDNMNKEIAFLSKWIKNKDDSTFGNFLLNSFWNAYN